MSNLTDFSIKSQNVIIKTSLFNLLWIARTFLTSTSLQGNYINDKLLYFTTEN